MDPNIQYSRITVSYKTSSFLLLFLLILINIQVSSFYTLEEGDFANGVVEDEKSLNSLDFYAPNSLGGSTGEDHDPLMPGMAKGHCNTLTSTVHVTKEEKDTNGLTFRSCEGDIIVSKCEGTCNSQLKPSVASPTGFKKVSRLFLKRSTTNPFHYVPQGLPLLSRE